MAATHDGSLEQGPLGEKPVEVHVERSESLHELPDPDAGKTEEERREIVRFRVPLPHPNFAACNTE